MLRKISFFTVFLLSVFLFSCQEKGASTSSDKFKVDPEPLIQDAMKKKKFLIIVFESADCKYCDKLNREVLNDLDFKQKVIKNNAVIAVVNVYGEREVTDPETGKKMSEQALAIAYRVQGYPTIAVFEPKDGKYSLLYEIPGYITKDDFTGLLIYLNSGCYKKVKYLDFELKGRKC